MISASRASALRLIAACLILFGTAACSDDQRTGSVDPATAGRDLDPAVVVQLDSGNAAFRRGAHEAALRHYDQVTDLAPDAAAGWFGLYMAHQAMGNAAAADSALGRARTVAPGASLLRVRPQDTLSAPDEDGGR